MYNSFDEVEFNQALKEKNYSYIKTCIISAIRNNPKFTAEPGTKKSEADYAFEEAISACPEMLEEYRLFEDEVDFDQTNSDNWNYEFFIRQTFRFGRNFCKKRYGNIKKVGQTITLKAKAKSNANFPQPQEHQKDKRQIQFQHNNMYNKSKNHKLAVLLVTIIAFIVLVAILIARIF